MNETDKRSDGNENLTPLIRAWLERGEVPFDEGLPIRIIRGDVCRRYEPLEVRGTVVLLHGIQSHSGWFTRSCSKLASEGYLVIAPDRRGSGGHAEYRGHIDSYEELIADIDAVIIEARKEFEHLPLYLMGVSWGGKLALFYEAMHPGRVDGLILSTPGIKVKRDLGLLHKIRIGLAIVLSKDDQIYVRIPIDIPHLFTDDPCLQEWIRNDRYTLRSCSARFYFESKRIDNLLRRHKAGCHVPILLMLAGRDDIIDNIRTISFLSKGHTATSSLPVEVIFYPSARHTMDFEPNWEEIALDLVNRLNMWGRAKSHRSINEWSYATNSKKLTLSVGELRIPLRHGFKHASAVRTSSESVIVKVSRGKLTGIGEGCPRIYVTGETTSSAIEWINRIKTEVEADISSYHALREWVVANTSEIDRNPAAWCAVEIACLDLLAQEADLTLEQMIGMPDIHGRSFRYTAVLGDVPLPKFRKTLVKYLLAGFSDFKMKIGGNGADLEKIASFKFLARLFCSRNATLRLDANNLWSKDRDAGIRHLSSIRMPLFGIEEPFGPRAASHMSMLSSELNTPIILDESLCRANDIELFDGLPGTWIGNVRVSKMGGILRSLKVIDEIKRRNWKVIVGCQVGESSILTRAALCVAAAAGVHLAGQEGAFGTWLLSHDPVSPVLMFGWRGRLKWSSRRYSPKGLGLNISKGFK